MSSLREGDEITVGDIVGLYPDGSFVVEKGAPQERLAVWRAGGVTTSESGEVTAIALEFVRQGRG